MFDSAPANLPIEPANKPLIPPQTAAPIDVPGNKEPEDMFSDIQEPSMTAQSSSFSAPLPPTRGGFPWKVLIGIGIPLGVLALGIGGWYVWQSYQPVTAVPEVAKQPVPSATVAANPEPGDESQTMPNPIPVPDETRAGATQASLALLQGQAQQEMQQTASATPPIPPENTNESATSVQGQTTPSTQPVDGQTTANEGEQGNVNNIPQPSGVNSGVVLAMGSDSDADGLSNAEEGLFGTNPEVKDTNGNGYEDGAEVKNGYDPLVRGVKLESSKNLKTETIGSLDILMPSVWTRKASAGGINLIQTGTPATFSVSMEAFASPMILQDWLIAKFPGSARQDYSAEKTIGGSDVVYSKDRLTAWLLLGNTVYTLRYAPNGAASLDFSMLFSLMIQRARMLP